MRDKGANLVEDDAGRGDGAEDEERAQRHPAEDPRRDQQGRPGPGAAFLPRPLTAKLALGRAAAEHRVDDRSEEHTSELQSLMRISYAVFCLKRKQKNKTKKN